MSTYAEWVEANGLPTTAAGWREHYGDSVLCLKCEHCARLFDSGRVYCDNHVTYLYPRDVLSEPRKHVTWDIHEPRTRCERFRKAAHEQMELGI